jgi:oligoribonuclease (3'-5' exoribonuclease)
MMARRFLPRFISRLHYRLLDVSTLKILWKDAGFPPFEKESDEHLRPYWPGEFDGLRPHDALFDIKASIAELRFYRSRIFPSER